MRRGIFVAAMRVVALAWLFGVSSREAAKAEEWTSGGNVFECETVNGVATITRGVCSGEVEIPATVGEGGVPVVAIGEGAFQGCDALAGVTIPNGVTNIASRAFALCTALEYVAILDPMAKVAPDAFVGCTSIAAAIVPPAIADASAMLFMESEGARTYRADRIDFAATPAVMRSAVLTGITPTSTPGVCEMTFDATLANGVDANIDPAKIRIIRASSVEEISAMTEADATRDAIASGISARDKLVVTLRVTVDTASDDEIAVSGDDEPESPDKRYFKVAAEQ